MICSLAPQWQQTNCLRRLETPAALVIYLRRLVMVSDFNAFLATWGFPQHGSADVLLGSSVA